MAEEYAAGTAATARGARIAASAAVTLALLAAGGVAFWRISPADETPSGYAAYLDRTGEPVLVVEAGNQVTPMTMTITTEGVLGTVAALPTETASLLLTAAGADASDSRVQVERALTSQVEPDGTILATTVLTLIRPDGYASALTTASNGNALLYSPPRIELPADTAPGSTWVSEGLVNLQSPYVYRGAVAAAEPRDGRPCIDVLTVLQQTDPGVDPYTRTTSSTWCRGLGSVESTTLESGLRFTLAAPGSVELGPVTPPTPQPLAPGTALPAPFANTGISLPPLAIGGLVLWTNGPLGDLVAVHPTPEGQRVSWVQHPGGEILGMATDGRLVFLTNTRRQLMAFDAAGRIHWIARLPDAAVGTPAVGTGLIAVSLLDGSVHAFAADDGSPRWNVRLTDTIATGAITAGDLVIAADTAGQVAAFAADGSQAWAAAVSAVRAALTPLDDGGVEVTDADGVAHRFAADGTERGSAPGGDRADGDAGWIVRLGGQDLRLDPSGTITAESGG